MKTVQIYNLHLVTGEVVQAAEDFELKGKKTIVSLFQRAYDEDIFLITDLLLGSCYIPKKNIAYIATGDVRVDAEPDRFKTNTCLLRRVKNCGSEDKQRNTKLHRINVFRTVAQTVHFFCTCVWCGSRVVLLTQTASWNRNSIVGVYFGSSTICSSRFCEIQRNDSREIYLGVD